MPELGLSHVVTAPEAAYVSLIATFDRMHRAGLWTDHYMPEVYDEWPIRVRALYAEIYPGGGPPGHGIPIAFHLVTSPRTALHLSYEIQGYIGRGIWQGNLPTNYGFGMTLRQGAVAAGDLIDFGAIYEPI